MSLGEIWLITFHTIQSLRLYILKHFTRVLKDRTRKKHDNFRPGYKLPHEDSGSVFWNVCKFYQTTRRHIAEDSDRCHKKTEIPDRHILYWFNIDLKYRKGTNSTEELKSEH